jgi:hypothetical protein
MTRKPTWSSVQDQEANVVITTGPESQRLLSGSAVMNTLASWTCSDDHVGFMVLQ